MELQLVGPKERYRPARLDAPDGRGYIHLAVSVEPPRGPIPVVRRSRSRDALVAQLRTLAGGLRAVGGVEHVTLYRAVLLPRAGAVPPGLAPAAPGTDAAADAAAFGEAVGAAPYDVAALVTTASPESLPAVMASEPFQAMQAAMRAAGQDLVVVPSRCARRFGEVDQERPGGLFLFNHFRAREPEQALDLWRLVAGWYVAETSLTNSLVLAPLGPSPYAFVNHARWDATLPALARRQFAHPTFRSFVLANLRANHVVAQPALYRLA